MDGVLGGVDGFAACDPEEIAGEGEEVFEMSLVFDV